MNNRLPRSSAVLLALTLAACATSRASGGARPSWIDGDSAQWSRARYVLGVGSADDDGTAAERARGEVARVFSASISVESTSEESESTSKQGGKEARSFTSSVAEKVRSATKQALEGVDIAARWKDPATARYYALAVLPKDQALLGVTEKLHELDDEAARYYKQLTESTDSFERAKAGAKILALAKSRADLANESRVLGGGDSSSSGVDFGAARAEAAKALAALNVVVAVSGEGAGDVATGVIKGLNAVGLTAKTGLPDDKADLMASTQVALTQHTVQIRGRDWLRTEVSAPISLANGRDGSIFARNDVLAREDAQDDALSRKRALTTLGQKTSEWVTKAINDYFANL